MGIFTQAKFKRVMSAALGMLAVIGVANAGPLVGNYTINSAQPTGGTNFQTFGDAVFALDQGVSGAVVFNVVPGSGPYTDQVTFFPVPGASAVNTITFNGHGDTLQFLSTNEDMKAAVKIDGADYIIFDSLVVKCLASDKDFEYGYGFNLLRNADHNIIRNCTVLNLEKTLVPQKTAGIVINGFERIGQTQIENESDSNIITGNTIIGGYEGIVVDGWSNGETAIKQVYGNQITNNTIKHVQYAAIRMIWTDGCLVKDNDISGRFYMSYSFGIYFDEANYNARIIGNKIHDFDLAPDYVYSDWRTGINIANCIAPQGKENVIANNIIYSILTPEKFTGIDVSGSTAGLNIYHNTFSFDAETASSATLYGVYSETANNTRLRISDNVVTIAGNGNGNKYAFYFEAALKDLYCDYNNVYLAANKAFVGRYAGATFSTVPTWNLGTGFDFHSISINPEYKSLLTGDLRPTAPQMDNYGKYAGVDKDIADSSRPNTYPDLGAYEFLSKPCSTPPNGGNTVAAPASSVWAAANILLTLSGNSAGKGQTYQWQSSTTENGTYTNIGAADIIPPVEVAASTTLYYRCEVTCEGVTRYSTPMAVIANAALPANTYTINKAQPTGGSNFASFNDAVSVLKCGIAGPVVFNVVPGSGPYEEQVVIPGIPGTSAVNTVTFKGNNEKLQFRSTASLSRAVIKLNGADYFTFDSLKITALGGTSQYGYGVQLINDADFNTISNCEITSADTTNSATNYAGIVVSASHTSQVATTGETNFCDSNNFVGNTIKGGIYGIAVSSAIAPNHVKAYNISNNKITDFYQYGIYVAGTEGFLIEGNDISRPTRALVPGSTRQNIETFNGIYAKTKNTSMAISKNKIHDAAPKYPSASGANGIYLDNSDGEAGKEIIVSNNLIYNFVIKGNLVGLYSSGSDYAKYYHNTISFDDQSFTGTSTSRAIYQTGAAAALSFKNNLVTITRTGTGKKHAIYIGTPSGTTYEADYNDYYVNGPNGGNFVGFLTNDQATIANWKTASSKDANSLDLKPFYADTLNGNYSPTLIELDNKGTFMQISTDLMGNARSATTPDIGAYEFSGTLPVKLISLVASKKASDILLSWTTANELNSKAFEVERSTDGSSFTAIGAVKANASGNYGLSDLDAANSFAGKTVYYRLKMVDVDGKYAYSMIVRLKLNGKSEKISIYPNPFSEALYTSIEANRNGAASIAIKNVSGATLSTQQVSLIPGTNLVKLANVAMLPKGVYMITIISDTDTQSFKVIK